MLLKFNDSCTLSIIKKQIVALAMMLLLLDCVLTLSEIRIRAGSLDSYTDTSGNLWLGDRYFNVGTMDKTSGVTFANTQEQDLYRFERWNDVSTQLAYTIPGLDAGVYTVNLHFSEFFETAFKVGVRVTDIYLQDKLVLSGYDIYKEVGAYAASVKTFEATVTSSGTLKIGLERIARNPKITAIHAVLKSTAYPPPSICPCSLPGSLAINSINPVSSLPLESVQITGRNFASGCIAYFGTIAAVQTTVQSSTSIQAVVPAGYTGLTSVTVKKGSTTSNGVDFTITRPSDHTAHSVPGEDYSITDAEDLGYVTVTLNGQGSHTHLLPPATLVSFEWKLGDAVLGTSVVISARIPVGVNPIRLKVVDSAGNADIAIITITVLPPIVNGVETYYYQYSSSLTKIPDIDSKKPDYGLIETNGVNYQTNFPATAYTSNFALEIKGSITTPTSGTYSFSLESDDGSKLIINGVTVIDHDGTHSMKTKSGTTSLSKGQHSFRVIYFQAAGGKGVKLYWKPPGSSNEIIPASALSFDQQFVKPVIHSIYPPSGGLAGGYRITITGFGFFYSSSRTTVTIGGKACTDVQVKDSSTIGCVVPASSAISASVVVTTPATTSNVMQFLYSDTSSVVSFQYSGLVSVTSPTVVKFGPDEKLYVGSVEGLLTRFTLDESMAVTDTVTSDVFEGKSILGINFNPKDFANTGNVYIYVTHSILYHDTTTDAVGGVSIVSGSRMNVVQDLITGLPVSERDHGINGLEFNQNLDLLVSIGSNTNGGLPGPLTPSETQTEKQLSASIIIAKISKGSSFRGNVRYTNNDSENGVQNDGLDVSVYASGIKNSYDLVLHSNGLLYATDNGPTGIYGKMSTSCTTEMDGETTVDELIIVTQGSYYGHPNRARAKAMNDPRQCVFRSVTTPSIPGEYTQGIGRFTSSIDGLFEYTANTFGGQMRGHLIIGRYRGGLYDVTLSSDGQSIVKSSLLAELNSAYGGLSTDMGFDGSIISTNYGPNMLNILKPQEPVPWNLPYIVSVFPFRGLMAGGNVVSVRGYGFSSDTTVTIDGKLCSNLSVVSNKKVRCTVPSTSVKGLCATVVVTSGGKQYTLAKAYWYTEV